MLADARASGHRECAIKRQTIAEPFGRTSTRLPPHLPHLARLPNDGTYTSSA